MASPAYFVDSPESAKALFGLMNPNLGLYDVENVDGAASLYKTLNPGDLYNVNDQESQAALYKMMNPDAGDLYNVDTGKAKYALYAKQNPGTKYMASEDHIWDDYGRQHYEAMKQDHWFRLAVQYGIVKDMVDAGQWWYGKYGKDKGHNLPKYYNAIYKDRKMVEDSELPDWGVYDSNFNNITDLLPAHGYYDADFNNVTKGVHQLYRGPGAYLSDGRAFHERLLPEFGYYDENFNKINPEGNSALANIYRYKQNEDAPYQEYYSTMEFPEMDLNPIAQRNLALRNNIARKRAPEAQYANNYIEWMKPQDDLMEEFIGNVTTSDLQTEDDIRDIMTAFAKQKYDQGVGPREMPQYRLAQEKPEQRTRDTGNYMSAMNRLYQPLTRNSRYDFGEPTRGLGEMNMSRGLSALMGSSPNSSYFSDVPTNFLSQLLSYAQQPTQTFGNPVNNRPIFGQSFESPIMDMPIFGNPVNGRQIFSAPEKTSSNPLRVGKSGDDGALQKSENINEDIMAKILNPSLGFEEKNQKIKDAIRDDDVAGIAKVLANEDRTLDDRKYLGLVDAPLEEQIDIGLISPDFKEEEFPYESLNKEQQEYIDKGGKVSDMFAADTAKAANAMIEATKRAQDYDYKQSAIAAVMNPLSRISEGSKQGLLDAIAKADFTPPSVSGRKAYELAPPVLSQADVDASAERTRKLAAERKAAKDQASRDRWASLTHEQQQYENALALGKYAIKMGREPSAKQKQALIKEAQGLLDQGLALTPYQQQLLNEV